MNAAPADPPSAPHSVRLAYRCLVCGYGAFLADELARCPMCGQHRWECDRRRDAVAPPALGMATTFYA